jgi:hypothetical protein
MHVNARAVFINWLFVKILIETVFFSPVVEGSSAYAYFSADIAYAVSSVNSFCKQPRKANLKNLDQARRKPKVINIGGDTDYDFYAFSRLFSSIPLEANKLFLEKSREQSYRHLVNTITDHSMLYL